MTQNPLQIWNIFILLLLSVALGCQCMSLGAHNLASLIWFQMLREGPNVQPRVLVF